MNTIKTSWESAELYGFKNGIRFAWVRYEVTTKGGITVGGDRRAVAVRELDTHGPRADIRTEVA